MDTDSEGRTPVLPSLGLGSLSRESIAATEKHPFDPSLSVFICVHRWLSSAWLRPREWQGGGLVRRFSASVPTNKGLMLASNES
jgi:hypothetical protein